MALKSENLLSIDFGTRSLKMVKGFFKNGNIIIDNTFLLDLPKDLYEDGYIKDMNYLREVMGCFLKLNNIKKDEVVAVINSTEILTRDIIIPNVEIDEIDGILKYMITDYIPIESEEYIVQYMNEGIFIENGNEKLKLFIIAMPKDIVKQHFNLLRDLGLKPIVLDFQSNSLRKLFFFSETIKSSTIVRGKTIASVDIGFYSTKLTILKGKNIEISRTLQLGLKDVLKNDTPKSNLTDEENLETEECLNNLLYKIFDSLEMIFRYYISQEEKNEIDLIILQGRIINTNYIKEKFIKYFNIKTIIIDVFDGILEANLLLYSNAIGGLIRGETI